MENNLLVGAGIVLVAAYLVALMWALFAMVPGKAAFEQGLFTQARAVLAEAYENRIDEHLPRIEPEPLAAASFGQVHRGGAGHRRLADPTLHRDNGDGGHAAMVGVPLFSRRVG